MMIPFSSTTLDLLFMLFDNIQLLPQMFYSVVYASLHTLCM